MLPRRRFLQQTAAAGAAFLPLVTRAANPGPSERNFRVGIIGSTGRGDYGHHLDEAWLKVPGAQVVAVADDDPFQETIEIFMDAGESGSLFEQSYGYAVFPTVGKGGFVVDRPSGKP